MMNQTLPALLDAGGLSRVREVILAASLRSIRVRAQRANEMGMAEGASKIGGRPDLPPAAEWPRYLGRPLSFLAQINLAEVQAFPAARQLPSRGLLSFFYDALEQPWGFDPADAGRWRVLFFPHDPQTLVRTEWPDELDDEGRFAAYAVSFEEEPATLPPFPSRLVEELQLTDGELDAYLALHGAIEEQQGGITHRLLGHPDAIQTDMQLECAVVTNGVNMGNITSYADPQVIAYRDQYRDWRLLFQLDSQEDAGMLWGDVGRLYFWMRADALAAQRFEDCWVILQCY